MLRLSLSSCRLVCMLIRITCNHENDFMHGHQQFQTAERCNAAVEQKACAQATGKAIHSLAAIASTIACASSGEILSFSRTTSTVSLVFSH